MIKYVGVAFYETQCTVTTTRHEQRCLTMCGRHTPGKQHEMQQNIQKKKTQSKINNSCTIKYKETVTGSIQRPKSYHRCSPVSTVKDTLLKCKTELTRSMPILGHLTDTSFKRGKYRTTARSTFISKRAEKILTNQTKFVCIAGLRQYSIKHSQANEEKSVT